MHRQSVLGISAYFHDSASALCVNGKIVAAAQEERFSRVKSDRAFPRSAIDYCLSEAGIHLADLDALAFYEKPSIKFNRLLETAIAFAPKGRERFCATMTKWVPSRLSIYSTIASELDLPRGLPIFAFSHHESHAASAFFPSPFEEAAILTVDGVGEWETTTISQGHADSISCLAKIQYPHSIGLLYSAFTEYLGFKVDSGEYKVMGLAPFGEPVFEALIRNQILDLRRDGSFRLNQRFFEFNCGNRMCSTAFYALFGRPPRKPADPLEQWHANLAASIQNVTSEALLRMAAFAKGETGSKRLAMAGGVALNCVANGAILKSGLFESVWVQPAAGDAGGALGAALLGSKSILARSKRRLIRRPLSSIALGPAFGTCYIERLLKQNSIPYDLAQSEQALLECAVNDLCAGRVIGWFQGRMEFGPRALGNRSILADPRNAVMQKTVNAKIKFRESFRPLAPAIIQEEARRWFDMGCLEESPFMLFCFDLLERHRIADAGAAAHNSRSFADRLADQRSSIPAVTHVDYSARVQTVNADDGLFYKLLKNFFLVTGCPVLLNTSFNLRGEPIVCTPMDALKSFAASAIDALYIGECIIRRETFPSVRFKNAATVRRQLAASD